MEPALSVYWATRRLMINLFAPRKQYKHRLCRIKSKRTHIVQVGATVGHQLGIVFQSLSSMSIVSSRHWQSVTWCGYSFIVALSCTSSTWWP